MDPDPDPVLDRCTEEEVGRVGERPTEDERGSCPGIRCCWLALVGLLSGFGIGTLPTCLPWTINS